jgi:PTH1 family peptidyl-tRNA hydrolase
MWILVPLGNPGEAYTATRHNLGRLVLQRWMEERAPRPSVLRPFRTGTLYGLRGPFQALVPGTYMNLSGQVCAEAAAQGLDPGRMILLCDDKDLPLGMGRFRLAGSDGGHNGLKSVFASLGRQDIPRLRLGIGPFQRPATSSLADFVLGEWTAPEWERIDALDAPFARFMELLAGTGDLASLASRVNPATFWEGEKPLETQELS